MAPPPKRVDAVEVHNPTAGPLKFRVCYDNHRDKAEMVEEATVAAGSSHVFGEKELDMGGWQAVAPVVKVQVTDGSGKEHALQPNVGGIVKLLKISAAESGGAVSLKQEQ